jgi:c-di-GMP-binding flagellar brake protein YcgR
MADERRKDPRVPMRLEAEVKFTSWHVYSLIYTINISKGGMNLELAEEPKPGTKVSIKLTPPEGASMVLDAVVRHATAGKTGGRWSVGVEFENLDGQKRDAIERAIRGHGGTLQARGLTPRK